RFIDCLFYKYKHFIYTYINNIIIASKNIEEYLKYIKTVLNIFNKIYIYISVEKSFIAYLSVRLLSYIVNSEGVAKIDDRIAIFKKLKFPNTLETLEQYL
ncbi:uncharacterized protein THITE_2013508, partial [Thermothielavioides terrestris NRRL 8126]